MAKYLHMSSPELSTEREAEKSWSYDTPYDIASRRQLVEKDEWRRVQDIDSFIAFVNEDMTERYSVVTLMDSGKDSPLGLLCEGTRVYRPNDQGQYEHHASIIFKDGRPPNEKFYGDKMFIVDEDVVLVNSEAGIGISIKDYAKLVSGNRLHNFQERLLGVLNSLNKDERRLVISDTQHGWH
jgi:hypothetical protein